MIEIRWIILLALWTLLIGPVIDLTQHGPNAQQQRSAMPKERTAR